ncbi:MAG: hypothetical protein ABSG68_25950, partial [Thermoguttaceae bacterium]
RIQQHRGGRLPFANKELYRLPNNSLRPITRGTNGVYKARKPYNLCTGLGTPPADLVRLLRIWD